MFESLKQDKKKKEAVKFYVIFFSLFDFKRFFFY